MNESGFIAAVNKKLPPSIYRWKTSDRYTAGVADVYYSSPKKDIWIEYKFYPEKLPKNVKPNLTELQKQWLNDRYDEGREVYVAVGSPKDCLLFTDKEWMNTKPASAAVSRTDFIQWIVDTLC